LFLRPLVWWYLKEQGLVKETGHTCRAKFALVGTLSGGHLLLRGAVGAPPKGETVVCRN